MSEHHRNPKMQDSPQQQQNSTTFKSRMETQKNKKNAATHRTKLTWIQWIQFQSIDGTTLIDFSSSFFSFFKA